MANKIEKSNVEDIYEMNAMQKVMLYHYLKDVGDNQYNVQLSLKVIGEIDLETLNSAFSQVQKCNPVLRSVFRWKEVKKPVQIILKDYAVNIQYYDLAVCLHHENEDRTSELSTADWETRFDLSELPIRISLFRLEENIHLLNITHHHILYDGWSTGVILKELFGAYIRLRKNIGDIPAKPSYKDFIRQSNQNSDDKIDVQDYWKKYLAGYEPVKLFKFSDQAPTIARETAVFSMEGMHSICARNNVTRACMVYTLVGILFQKYFDVDDILLGAVISNRPLEISGSNEVVGNFVNTIPLRICTQEQTTFYDLLMNVNQSITSGQAVELLELSELKKILDVSVQSELFEVLVVMENYPIDKDSFLTSEGLQVTLKSFSENYNAPLTLSVFMEDQLVIEFNYKLGVVPSRFVKDFQRCFNKILNDLMYSMSFVENVRPSEMSLLTEEEKRVWSKKHRGTKMAIKEESVLSYFERQVLKSPDNIAIKYCDQVIRYGEVSERVERLTAYLRQEKRVVKGDLIGLILERDEHLIPVIFAILKAGAAYVPIGVNYPSERVRTIVHEAQLKFVITRKGASMASEEDFLVKVDINDLVSVMNEYPFRDGGVKVLKGDLAYVMYTSGSSGKPKGVMIEHRSLTNLIVAIDQHYPLRDHDCHLLKTPYTFDISVSEIFGWFLRGGALSILPPGEERQPQNMLDVIASHHVTHLTFVPSLFYFFLEVLNASTIEKIRSLQYILFCGEVLPAELVRKFTMLGTGILLENLYGPTETTIYSSVFSTRQLIDQPSLPIGNPICNVDYYVMDRLGNICPDGVAGELYIGGVQVARGYLSNEALTKERFIVNPYEAGDVLYKTGDLVCWNDDGYFDYLGRIDGQVKIRGNRIELGEIEELLLKNPEIIESAAAVKEINGQKYLLAYYVAADDLSTDALRAHLAVNLPEYMLPHHFMRISQLPLSAHGKLSRGLLPHPDFSLTEEYVAPANEVEERLIRIWADLLNLSEASIGVVDSFFDRGGHSLNAMSLLNRIYRDFGLELSLSDIFSHNNIRSQGGLLAERMVTPYEGLQRAPVQPWYDLSPAQRRQYFLYCYHPDSLAYNMPFVARIEGNVSVSHLREAFAGLIQRYEILRARFYLEAGEPVQQIEANVTMPWEFYENGTIEEILPKFIRPFDLSMAPLIRAGILKGQGSFYLLIDLHHIVTDGISHSLLMKDFVRLYIGDELPMVEFQYKDYLAWQRSDAYLNRLSVQSLFWNKQFSHPVPILELPYDYDRPSERSYKGSVAEFTWSASRSNLVHTLAASEDCTVFMVLLSCYYILLSRLSGESDITVGTPVAGRDHADLERIVGMFINTLCLRCQVSGEKDYVSFLRDVRETVVQGLAHQDYPYEDLLDNLSLRRDISRNALFDTVFVYQNFNRISLEIPGAHLTEVSVPVHTSKFDLTFRVENRGEQLHFSIEYSTQLFKASTIDRFWVYYNRIVSSVLSNRHAVLSSIALLSSSAQRLYIKEFDRSAVSYSKEKTLVSIWREQAMLNLNRVALRYEGNSMTYDVLCRRSNQISQYLHRCGVTASSVVGLLLDNSADTVIGILGILQAGCGYLPLSAEYPEGRLRYMLEDSGAKWILTSRSYHIPVEGGMDILYMEDSLSSSEEFLEACLPTPGDLAYIIYTSGTTGFPKGVMVSHQNVVRLFYHDACLYDFSASDVWTLFHSHCFDFSVWEIFGALLYGGRLVVIPRVQARDSREFLNILHAEGVTILNQTPSSFYNLISQEASLPKRMSSVRQVIFGGECLTPGKLRSWRARYPSARLINMYGITETTVHVTYKELEDEDLEGNRNTIGRPLSTLSIYVLDQYGNLVPPGVKGELYVGGAGLSMGYIGQESLTRARFIDHPFKVGEKLYRSGDYGRIIGNGDLEYLGRGDHQVQIRGYRVELGEIEGQLQRYVGIKETLVISQQRGEYTELWAYYVSDVAIPSSSLRGFLSDNLAEYMLPTYFIHLSQGFPLTTNGKLDRASLPVPALEKVQPEWHPVNDLQKGLVELWSSVLSVSSDRIGINTNFFEIGGNSLHVVKLADRMAQVYGVKVSVANIFAYPVIRQQADYLSEQLAGLGQDQAEKKHGQDRVEVINNTLGILGQLHD